MNPNATLQYVGKCGMWFRATPDYGASLTMAQIRDYMTPALDTQKVCSTRMVQWLAYDSQTQTLEGVVYPEHIVAALELLRPNCRALDFHAVNS